MSTTLREIYREKHTEKETKFYASYYWQLCRVNGLHSSIASHSSIPVTGLATHIENVIVYNLI